MAGSVELFFVICFGLKCLEQIARKKFVVVVWLKVIRVRVIWPCLKNMIKQRIWCFPYGFVAPFFTKTQIGTGQAVSYFESVFVGRSSAHPAGSRNVHPQYSIF